MTEVIRNVVEMAGSFLSVSGVLVIVVGLVWTLGMYIKNIRRISVLENFHSFKRQLAHVLMVAMGFLVVADVIETLTREVTFESLAALGILVIVRTWLSWTMDLEANGRWPWQTEAKGANCA